jgi:hypothetical protein
MIYDTRPNTVPAGFIVALVWRCTCARTGRVTLATETRHTVRTEGTHRHYVFVASPHAAEWTRAETWKRRRARMASAVCIGWAAVHREDDAGARMAHAAALDTGDSADDDGTADERRAALARIMRRAHAYARRADDATPYRERLASALRRAHREARRDAACEQRDAGQGDRCEACDGEGVMTFDTGCGTFAGPTCEACDGAGRAPALPLPPMRFTARALGDETPVHEAPHAPAADLYEVRVPSSSRAGVEYRVTHGADGWARTCPHWRYRKPAGGCKHIDAARIARRRPQARAVAA